MRDEIGTIRLSLRLIPRSGTENDPQATAGITAVAIFPAKLINESCRGFFLPSNNNFFRTAVRELPEKLLPRKFFGIPLAIQSEDAAGNHSLPVVFDIAPGEELLRDAIIPRPLEIF